MTPDLFAYSLRNQEPGWSWHVYDVDGRIVASGLEGSRNEAAEAVNRIIGEPRVNEPRAFARRG